MSEPVAFEQMSAWRQLIRLAAGHPGAAPLGDASLDAARGVLADCFAAHVKPEFDSAFLFQPEFLK